MPEQSEVETYFRSMSSQLEELNNLITELSAVEVYSRSISSQLEQLDHRITELTEVVNNKKQQTTMLSIKEAANYLKVCPGTLYRYHAEGTIKAYKTGKFVKFKKEDLDEHLYGNASKTTEEIKRAASEYCLKNPR